MIAEDYISFETAKLLKEKGFDEECRAFYVKSKECGIELFHAKEPYNYNNNVHPCTSAPTLQLAMKWLRKIHHIIVAIGYDYEFTDTSYCYKIYQLGENGEPKRVAITGVSDRDEKEHIVGFRDYKRSYKDYATYEDAVEDGIRYCLENLI